MSQPLLSMGLIADMHYLDAENGSNYDQTKTRRFRQSLEILQEANKSFQNNHMNVLLGDILDGKAKTLGMEMNCLQTIQKECQKYTPLWYLTLGNHEYYNFNRNQIYDHVYLSHIQSHCQPNRLFYSFIPVTGYRCIVLDGYEISTIGAISSDDQQIADDLIRAKNHNYAAGSSDWLHNLPPENMRYLPFNGGVSEEQLQWLKLELQVAIENHEKCLLFSHMAIYSLASQEQNVLFNCEEILSILHSTPRNTILMCISGHDHDGGYAVDQHGIHHMVPCSPIECEEGEVSYGSIHFYSDEIRIDWTGKVPSRIWSERILIGTESGESES